MSAIVVYHSLYGCETGCCGHRIEVDGAEFEFTFSHPWSGHDGFRDWAESLVAAYYGEEHVKDLDWANCLVIDD